MNERVAVAAAHDGNSSIRYRQDIGLPGAHVTAMHVTVIDPGDIGLLAATGTAVIHGACRKAREALISPFLEPIEGGCDAAIAADRHDLRFAAMPDKIRAGRPEPGARGDMTVVDISGPLNGSGFGPVQHLLMGRVTG